MENEIEVNGKKYVLKDSIKTASKPVEKKELSKRERMKPILRIDVEPETDWDGDLMVHVTVYFFRWKIAEKWRYPGVRTVVIGGRE